MRCGGGEVRRPQAVVGPDALQMAFGEGRGGQGRRFADAAGERLDLARGGGAREPIGGDLDGGKHGADCPPLVAQGRGKVNGLRAGRRFSARRVQPGFPVRRIMETYHG